MGARVALGVGSVGKVESGGVGGLLTAPHSSSSGSSGSLVAAAAGWRTVVFLCPQSGTPPAAALRVTAYSVGSAGQGGD